MRRLLLLLLTLLIPLQLLAATGETQLRQQLRVELQPPAGAAASCPQAEQGRPDHLGWHTLTPLADMAGTSDSAPPATGDDDDFPSLQGELEDPTLPAPIATPELHWHPFPHVFSAIPVWSSFLRDQLRPPPLA